MIATSFTELVGCRVPIQLAGIGGSNPDLAAAVGRAGGLGMVGAVENPPAVLESTLAQLRTDVPDGKFGVNFIAPFLNPECVEVAANGAALVEFFFDTPDPDLIRRVHDGGALASWQVGSPEEAQQAIHAGCDMIVAQGVEAGGHVRGTAPVLDLLEDVLKFADIPVLAAGGLGGGKGLAAALKQGASGVRIGTQFLTAYESGAHPQYIDALLAAKAEDTVMTREFEVGWPDASHRVLRSSLEAARHHADETVGTMVRGGEVREVPRFHVSWPNASATGDVAAMCHYAGESVDAVTRRQSVAEIVDEIMREAEELIR